MNDLDSTRGSPSGWRLDFGLRWLDDQLGLEVYKREADNRPSNDRGDMDWTRFDRVLRELEGKSSEPQVKYKRKR